MNAPRLSVVVPVFNEQDNVAPLIREIVAALRGRAPEDGGDFEIVYVDDHSSDDTLAALRGLKAEVPELRVLRHAAQRSEEHTSELQSLMRISYAVFCLKKKNNKLHILSLTSTAIYSI